MSELQEKLLEIKNQKDTYIIPENLKKNVTAFGVTGTYEGSDEGDVKLFETVEEMQQDPNPQEGDLAVVYREETYPITEESEFDGCTFPSIVILDEAVTDSTWIMFRSTGSDWFEAEASISSSSFYFNGYGNSSEVRITYTSSDGITFTRTDGGDERIEFGTTIAYMPYEPWNDIFSKFIKIGGKKFDGLFRYNSSYRPSNIIQLIPYNAITIQKGTNNNIYATWNGIYHENYYNLDDIYIMINKIFDNYSSDKGVSSLVFTLDEYNNPILIGCKVISNVGKNNIYSELNIGIWDLEGNWLGTGVGRDNKGDDIIIFHLDLDNYTYTEETMTPTGRFKYSSGTYDYIYYINNLHINCLPITFRSQSIDTNTSYFYYVKSESASYSENLSSMCNYYMFDALMNPLIPQYISAPNQFTLTSANELLPNKIALGKYGETIGTDDIYNNLDVSKILVKYFGIPSSSASLTTASEIMSKAIENGIIKDGLFMYILPYNIEYPKTYYLTPCSSYAGSNILYLLHREKISLDDFEINHYKDTMCHLYGTNLSLRYGCGYVSSTSPSDYIERIECAVYDKNIKVFQGISTDKYGSLFNPFWYNNELYLFTSDNSKILRKLNNNGLSDIKTFTYNVSYATTDLINNKMYFIDRINSSSAYNLKCLDLTTNIESTILSNSVKLMRENDKYIFVGDTTGNLRYLKKGTNEWKVCKTDYTFTNSDSIGADLYATENFEDTKIFLFVPSTNESFKSICIIDLATNTCTYNSKGYSLGYRDSGGIKAVGNVLYWFNRVGGIYRIDEDSTVSRVFQDSINFIYEKPYEYNVDESEVLTLRYKDHSSNGSPAPTKNVFEYIFTPQNFYEGISNSNNNFFARDYASLFAIGKFDSIYNNPNT